MEELYGERRAVMEQVLDMGGLKRAIAEAKRPELTHLKLPDDMEHPDDAFTLVSYIKGANFLFFLEDRFGRDKFDPFLKAWFNDYAFQSVTTEDFISYLHQNLIRIIQTPSPARNLTLGSMVRDCQTRHVSRSQMHLMKSQRPLRVG